MAKRQLGEKRVALVEGVAGLCLFQGRECMQGVTLGIAKGWAETLMHQAE
jgi:hypothetical protein